ncbi:phosphatase PAP2 family protein [Nocardioides pakistanensis]
MSNYPSKREALRATLALALTTALVCTALLLEPLSTSIYLALLPETAQLEGIHHLADVALATLGVTYATALWRSRFAAASLARGVAAGIGVGVAYLVSEVAKLAFIQERPCREALLLERCPPPGDWSFPSNHMTIAVGLAVASAATLPQVTRPLVATLTALVAAAGAGRLGQGAHYPHDLLAGMGVGLGVVVAVALTLGPMVESSRLLTRWSKPVGQ